MSLISLGIDASAKSSGLTYINGNIIKVKRILPKKHKGATRLNYVHTEVCGFLRKLEDPGIIVMEGPSFLSTNKPFILGEIYGVFKLICYQLYSKEVLLVPPKKLKKYLAGSGDATKEMMKISAMKYGCPTKQEDICDSFAAALLGKDLIGNTNSVGTRKALEIITSYSIGPDLP